MAEPQVRGDSAACAVDTVSVTWQARDVVNWPATAAPKPGAVTELLFMSGQTPWYKVLEPNVATASGMKVVCTFSVRVKGLQGKKRAEFIFGVGKGLHGSWWYQMYHEDDGRSVWYGLRGLQGVGGHEVPESVMKACTALVNERKPSYVGGRGHTRGAAIEVEGDDEDDEDKEHLKDGDKDKGKDKAKGYGKFACARGGGGSRLSRAGEGAVWELDTCGRTYLWSSLSALLSLFLYYGIHSLMFKSRQILT